jgi:protein-tyrosine-phosphatase
MSPPTPQRRVLFVCTHNAGRSIVAAALLNAHQPPGVRADSAGTDPSDALNPTVVTALTVLRQGSVSQLKLGLWL